MGTEKSEALHEFIFDLTSQFQDVDMTTPALFGTPTYTYAMPNRQNEFFGYQKNICVLHLFS